MSEGPGVCGVCGGKNFTLQGVSYFCLDCQSQSQDIRNVAQNEVFSINFNLASQVKVSNATTKEERKRKKPEFEHKWTTNEAFNIILKKLVSTLIKMGADRELEKVVFKIWGHYLKKTKYAFCKPRNQTTEWIPKVPLLPRDRDQQVMLEDRSVILAKKFRRSFRKSTVNYRKRIARRKARTLRTREENEIMRSAGNLKKKKMGSENNSAKKPKKINDANTSNLPEQSTEFNLHESANESALPEQTTVSNLEKATTSKLTEESITSNLLRPENANQGKRTWKTHKLTTLNSISLEKVNKIGRMTMERVIDMLYLGLLLVHEHVLLCDLLRWIETSELPLLEIANSLPDKMKFQTYDNSTFRLKVMPTQEPIRINTAKLAKFISIHHLPPKTMPEIVARFVRELNLPSEINQLAINLMKVDPPTMPLDNEGKKRTYPIPNYEGRALGFIIVILKLLFGVDGKTEKKQSKYTRKLSAIVTDEKLFCWDDWVRTMQGRFELKRQKSIFDNIDSLENFTDVDRAVNHYLTVGKNTKGRFCELRNYTYMYRLDETRDPIKEEIGNLITDKDILTKNIENSVPDMWGSAFIENTFNSNNELFHDRTLKHILEPDWVESIVQPKGLTFNIIKSNAWTKSNKKSSKGSLNVYQPFYDYPFLHFNKDKRSEFAFVAFKSLPTPLVWLVDVCSACGRLPPKFIYEEVMLIEKVLIKMPLPHEKGYDSHSMKLFNFTKFRRW